MFYTYKQTNSAGITQRNDERGITNFVIIEAGTTAEADTRAEAIGLYFDGVKSGRDCRCCGDRWKRAEEGFDTLQVHGKALSDETVFEELDYADNGNVVVHSAGGAKYWWNYRMW